jgi:hypothetical protein
MKRLIIITLIAVLGLVAFVPTPAQAAQVFCRVPTAHKVVCFNYTPYAVYMRVTVHTAYGPRYFQFWNYYTRWVKYFVPVVYSVNWRWHS